MHHAFYSAVDIGPIVINSTSAITGSSDVTGIAGDQNVTIECSVDITPNPLPEDVPSPSFGWFFGPTNSSLPSGVIVSNVTNSGNTYTSTLQFSPLRESHAGMYTCRLGGNERLATNANIAVNGKPSRNQLVRSISAYNEFIYCS